MGEYRGEPLSSHSELRELFVYVADVNLSVQLHQDALATPKVAEELNKLMPFLGPGSGAWYAMFKKHISSAE